MKKYFSNMNIEVLKQNLQNIVHRFPLPLLLSLAVTMIIFYLIATDIPNQSQVLEILLKFIFTFSTLFFLSVWVSLFRESEEKKWINNYLIFQVPVLVFWVLFYYGMRSWFENFNSIIYIILTLVWIISYIFFAPFTKNTWKDLESEASYLRYFYHISFVFFVSLIVGGTLALLGNWAILAVENLFDVSFSNSWNIYGYWTTLALALFSPLFFLSELPKASSFENDTPVVNVFLSFLTKYILVPFVFVYFIILYAYSIKVLLNFWDWPKGQISWMVIVFSILGYIAYIFSSIFESAEWNNKFIELFRKYFPYAVIPQTAMLFYAIALRIGQYDITINRYFVVVFWLWLVWISLYFIISKAKSLLYIPAALTLITIVISIWPWSVYSLPISRQVARLENNLQEARILTDSIEWRRIIPLENYTDINQDISKQIYDGIEYICNYNNCEELRSIFPLIMQDIETQDFKDFQNKEADYSYLRNDFNWYTGQEEISYPWVSNWKYIQKITDIIKVQSYFAWQDERQFISINFSPEVFQKNLDISGYDTLNILSLRNWNDTDLHVNTVSEELYYNTEESQETIDLSNVFEALRTIWSSWELQKTRLEYLVEWEKNDFKIIVTGAYLYVGQKTWEDSNNTVDRTTSLDGYILIKNK